MDDYARPAFWQPLPRPPAETPQPHGPHDVCIVGAGIAGLSTAYRLVRRGRRVLVIDDGGIGGGQTGRTTAHLSCVLDDRYAELERLRGTAAARAAMQSHAAAIDAIEETVAQEGIDCAFRRVDGYLFADGVEQAETLGTEAAAAERAGLRPKWLDRAPLPGPAAGPCLRFAGQAQFDPAAYLGGLLRVLTAAGATILTGTRVVKIHDAPAAGVETADGTRYPAEAVVVATNSPISSPIALPLREFAYNTYVVGLEAPADFPDGLFWDLDDPYHYVRIAERSHDGARLLLVGGEDHPTGRGDADPHACFARLEDWARRRMPGAGAAVQRWSGQVLETPDGLAFIGRSPGATRVFVATGDSGMGMTHGTIASLLLPELIEGREHDWAALYDPARLPLKTLGECAREALMTNAAYRYWLRGDGGRPEDLRPGQGAVLRQGLRRRALYRDADGALHAVSPVCPHMGGRLRWNPVERTWDCPVHGSRFDRHGELLQGPANAPLNR